MPNKTRSAGDPSNRHVFTVTDLLRSKTPEALERFRETRRQRTEHRAGYAVDRYQRGMVPAAIADLLGVNERTVLTYLREAKVPLRPRYGRGVIEK